jgi:hypothetical protein
MGLILGDTIVALSWIILKPLFPRIRSTLRQILHSDSNRHVSPSPSDTAEEERPFLQDQPSTISTIEMLMPIADGPNASNGSFVTPWILGWSWTILSIVYLVSVLVGFSQMVSALTTIVAMLLIPMTGFISIRSLGETDNGASLAIGTSTTSQGLD